MHWPAARQWEDLRLPTAQALQLGLAMRQLLRAGLLAAPLAVGGERVAAVAGVGCPAPRSGRVCLSPIRRLAAVGALQAWVVSNQESLPGEVPCLGWVLHWGQEQAPAATLSQVEELKWSVGRLRGRLKERQTVMVPLPLGLLLLCLSGCQWVVLVMVLSAGQQGVADQVLLPVKTIKSMPSGGHAQQHWSNFSKLDKI